MKNLIIIIGTILLGVIIVNTMVLGDSDTSLQGAAQNLVENGIESIDSMTIGE
ncbi:hypothetical protein ACPW7J_06055 [Ihubacter sp. rT4E-8]|uniref:hypothetical protein n=1 Tax=unclassified Ihubacter TaxID=2633299 RepID=UPI00137B5F12